MNPSFVVTGTVNGSTNIETDVANALGSAVPVLVTLSTNYALANPRPPGFPTIPSLTGAAEASAEYPGLVLQGGSTFGFLACEATALVNAGAGSFA